MRGYEDVEIMNSLMSSDQTVVTSMLFSIFLTTTIVHYRLRGDRPARCGLRIKQRGIISSCLQ